MLKRMTALFLTLCLAVAFAGTAEEANTEFYDFFFSRAGNIVFTMNELPDHVYREADFVRGAGDDLDLYMGITDNTQLTYSDEDGEWQYHIADLSGMIEEIRADHPEAEEDELRFNALVNFAYMYTVLMTPGTVSGDPTSFTIGGEDTAEMVGIEWDYTYDDTPGVAYRCTGLIDGSRAVLLMGSYDDRYAAMVKALGPVTPEQEEMYAQRMTPTRARLGELTLTFPCVPDFYEDDGQVFYDAFTSDYSYLSAEHIEMDMSGMIDSADEENSLLELLDYVGQQYAAAGAVDSYEAGLFAPGLGLIKCVCAPQIEDFEDSTVIWMFYSIHHGPYVLYSTSSEIGTAFLNSVALAE